MLVVVVGAGAFLYPFWLPGTALPNSAHTGDAPLVAAVVGALVVAAITLEVRRGTMNGATVAILGVLAASAGLLRLLDLPGGGNGIFFLIVLAGAAFGPRFGLLLGLCAMAVSAIITGGIGPWLPFQMLALAWMGGLPGCSASRPARLAPRRRGGRARRVRLGVGLRLRRDHEPVVLAVRPRRRPAVVAPGPRASAETLHHYWSFYVATSLGLGRGRRAHERGAHPAHRRGAACAPSAASPTASTPSSSSTLPPPTPTPDFGVARCRIRT